MDTKVNNSKVYIYLNKPLASNGSQFSRMSETDTWWTDGLLHGILSTASWLCPALLLSSHTDSGDRPKEYRTHSFYNLQLFPTNQPSSLLQDTLLSLGLDRNKNKFFLLEREHVLASQEYTNKWRTVWIIKVQILVNPSFRTECILSHCTWKISNSCVAYVSLNYVQFSVKQTMAFSRHYK